jgi:hypothetical protein
MATPIKFKAGEVKKLVKENPIAMASLGVASTNLAVNASRHKRDTKYQKEQIDAMNKLTGSINNLDSKVNSGDKKSPGIFKFKRLTK